MELEFRTQNFRSGNFIANFLIRFVDIDFCPGAGGETAVGVQRDAFWREKLCGLANPRRNRFGRINLPRRNADAAQTNFKIFAQFFEDSHVTSAGRGEFHREMMNFQRVELFENWVVAALELRFAANARARSTSEMHGEFYPADSADELIDHVHREISGGIGVVIFRAHFGIDEQTKMRVVNLRDVGSR